MRYLYFLTILMLFILLTAKCQDETDIHFTTPKIISITPNSIDASNSSNFSIDINFSEKMKKTDTPLEALDISPTTMNILNNGEIDASLPDFITTSWSDDGTILSIKFNVRDQYLNPVNLFKYSGKFIIRNRFGDNFTNGGLANFSYYKEVPDDNTFRTITGDLLPMNEIICSIDVISDKTAPKVYGELQNTNGGIAYIYLMSEKNKDSNLSNNSLFTIVDTNIQTNYELLYNEDQIKKGKYYIASLYDNTRRTMAYISSKVNDLTIGTFNLSNKELFDLSGDIEINLNYTHKIHKINFYQEE